MISGLLTNVYVTHIEKGTMNDELEAQIGVRAW